MKPVKFYKFNNRDDFLSFVESVRNSFDYAEEWEKFYMGDDGTFTFYIDLVNQTFSKNSVIAKTKSIPMNGMTIDEMFEVVKTTNWED